MSKKRRVDKKIIELEFEANIRMEYEVKASRNSAFYINKAEGNLPGLYYLIA